MDSFRKQSNEVFVIGVDHSKVLDTGESIVVGTSTVTAIIIATGVDATATVLNQARKSVATADEDDISVDPITNGMLQIGVIAGAEADSPYKLTFLAKTTNGNTYETDVKMKVKEI